jgi:uncharacterized protein YmfQ (DUF2313 family)
MTEFQPALPVEVPFTDAEQAFLEESPPGLYPDNQNSNLGFLIRKVWCDGVQDVADQMTTLYAERFIPTSFLFLEDWEIDLGILVDPASLTISQRRANCLAHLRTGAFTREMRNGIIEEYINATFGDPMMFSVAGIPFVSGGIPFHSDPGDISSLYAVVEDLTNFTYQVRIKNTITPDEAGMRRALDRVTPAGISYTIVYVPVP